jgi:hypothetical protein
MSTRKRNDYVHSTGNERMTGDWNEAWKAAGGERWGDVCLGL